MTKAEAEAEAIKRERHKSKHLSHRRWEATHTPERGWHVALVECPYHAAEVASQKAFAALRGGDMRAFHEAAGEALMARMRASISASAEDPSHQDSNHEKG